MTRKGQAALLLLLAASGLHSCVAQLEWWQTATFYQIYPRSFKDSLLADGIGDLLGIKTKLDHLVDIGIGGVWLSPVFKSPMKDFGYDISDFRDIDPIFGNMDDMKELIAECKLKGLKLIMDFVPNHSSDEHDWFIRSVAGEAPYDEYYTWKDAKGLNGSGDPIPPTNWLSVFGGSAWKWNEQRQQFYYHQFHEGQPDLNFRNPLVRQEMNEVIKFWLDLGVDGFRFDAVPHLMEDQGFLDEPPSGNPGFEPGQWDFLSHIYTKDLAELYDIIYEFRATMDAKQEELGTPLVMMVEAYTDIEHTMQYYGNATSLGAHFPFNFQFIVNVNNDTKAQGMQDMINEWMDNMPKGQWANWVIGNHDQPRVASRFGSDFGLAAVIVGQLLPGTAFTYNGEEIGMESTWISWEDTEDPQGCGAGEEDYEKFSRDPCRTPFQWNAEPHAGFSPPDSTLPWLPVNENYLTLNLEAQKAANNSHYHVYKRLTAARTSMRSAQIGDLYTEVINEDVFAFVRALQEVGEDSLLVVVNTGVEVQNVSVLNVSTVTNSLKFYTGSLDAEYTVPQEGQEDPLVDVNAVMVPARGAVVFRYSATAPSGVASTAASALLLAFATTLALLGKRIC